MNRIRKITILEGTSLIALVAALALLPSFGGTRVLSSLASDDDAEFTQAMVKVRVVAQYTDTQSTTLSGSWTTTLTLKDLGNPQCALLLAQFLAREEPLRIAEGSPLPGVMPPLEMLKSVAIDALVEVKATQYLPAIESVYRQTTFMVL